MDLLVRRHVVPSFTTYVVRRTLPVYVLTYSNERMSSDYETIHPSHC